MTSARAQWSPGQYQTQGVVFGTASSFGQSSPGPGDCGSPTVQTGTVPANSSPNYAQLPSCQSVASGPSYSGTYGAFTNYPRGSFSVYVREPGVGIAPMSVTLTGYDSNGNPVATGTGTVNDSSWTRIVASQSSGSPIPARISYFFIAPGAASTPLAIDDFAFDQAGAPLSASGSPFSATAGTAFTGPVATITDADPTATASDFAATITWGDGASSAGTVAASGTPGQFTVTGTHNYGGAGIDPVHIAITKVNGRTTSADTTATVSGAGGGGGSPTATVTLLTAKPIAGDPVTLSGATSTPGQGKIISYDWDFNNDGTIDTSTGTNPIAQFVFTPGFHTVALTVTNSNGQKSTSKFGLNVNSQTTLTIPDGGTGPCTSTYNNGDVQIVADCIQTLPGGGYVIQTHVLDLNGMTIAPKTGFGAAVFKILPFKLLGVGSGTHLYGPAVNFELLNTPIGNVTIGGQDLSTNPMQLSFTPYFPPKFQKFGGRSGPSATAADDSKNKQDLMSIGVGHSCTAGSKDPTCCPPPGPTTSCATLPGGFPLTGTVNVYVNNNNQILFDVNVALNLSAVNFQATGSLEVSADVKNGINLDSLKFTIPQAGLASVFQVKDASFVYYFPSGPDPTKRDTWQAKATLIFGPLSQPSLAAELDFHHGDFHYASMLFTAPSGSGVPIYPGILLNQLGGSIGVNPTQFGGQLGASIAATLELSLAFKYSDKTDTTLGFFGGQGKLSYNGDDIATLSADVYSDGYTDAQLNIDLHFPFDSSDPAVKVGGTIGFWDEPKSGRWEADGSVYLKLWVISAEVAGLINNQYIAGCADVNGVGVQGRYRLSDGNIDGGAFVLSNCTDQLKQYKETPVDTHTGGFVGSFRGAGAAAAAAGGGTIKLPSGGLGQELLISSTSGSPPVLTVTGPTGEQFTTPSAPGQVSSVAGKFFSAIAPDGSQVIVLLRSPAAGKWTLAPVAGSPALGKVEVAGDIAPARVRIRVRHLHARRYALAYRVSNYVAGDRIQFVERGHDSTNVLGTVHAGNGTFGFSPQDAIGRRRTIFAYLQNAAGAPLRTLSVGAYVAPAAQRPGKVLHASFTRQGSTGTLSWSAAPAARQYRVTIKGTDGRLETLFAGARARRITVAEALPERSFAATIVPQGGPNLLDGPARRAALPASATGSVEALTCAKGVCHGTFTTGDLVLSSTELQATLRRGGRTVATGIASDLKGPRQITVAVSRALGRGSYALVLSYRRGGRVHTVSRHLTLR